MNDAKDETSRKLVADMASDGLSAHVEGTMKRCRVGTWSYGEANDLHAECYGLLGVLLLRLSRAEARIAELETD